ncbi:oligosaccharide flippase family protein [Fulvivirgaceae bacterium BMA10]|uniref:Oligosaccharide flippase family protein n=1 Tax=Splendidivirga corallicola TaxID=3051826 RepID=A0ABT8KNI3_9BACT|nr:oligosaccharide flippase family protein [Fulvivirgaceae bacterium BMA10]
MNPLKKLAGQTVIYGGSTILARLLNYLLVRLHTDSLKPDEYGIYTDLYAYMALFMVVYTYGMETAFFRFATKGDKKEIYSTTTSSIILSSIVFTGTLVLFSPKIAGLLGYDGFSEFIVWLACILFIDAIVAIPFAKLRLENKPMKFATIKLVNILVTIFLQLFLLWLCPRIHEGKFLVEWQPFINSFWRPEDGVKYIILSNLIANALLILFLWRSLASIKFGIKWHVLKPLFIYGWPILITGLAGIANERFDVVFLGDFLPEDFYPDRTNRSVQGIYGSSVKLSVFMLLGIQAFRYAAEPFFFSSAKDKNAPELFARVMHFFVIACTIIFVGVSINVELIADLLISGKDQSYREALYIVPYLLFGKLFFGIYVNLSIWFKLTDKTIYGMYFSLTGLVITVLGNYLLIPLLGWEASAFTGIATYSSMVILCYLFGQKFFPIPYKLLPIVLYLMSGMGVIYLSNLIYVEDELLKSVFNLVICLFYIVIIFLIEKKNLKARII